MWVFFVEINTLNLGLGIVVCLVALVVVIVIIGINRKKNKDGTIIPNESELEIDLNSTLMRDKRIKEKSLGIQNRLIKTKARFNSDAPKSKDNIAAEGTINISELAGDITDAELLEDKKRMETPALITDTGDGDKSTTELLDEYEVRNKIGNVRDIEKELIEYDGNSLQSFRK